MEDARSIILPPQSTVDTIGIRQALELFVQSSGARWAELVIRTEGSTRAQVVRLGDDLPPATSLDLDLGGSTLAVLRLAGVDHPPTAAVDLLAASIRRELHRLRLIAESSLLRQAFDASMAAVMIFGPDGSIVFANRKADELMSRQTEDELTATSNGSGPQPLFRLLCSNVSELLDGTVRSSWWDRLLLSDGSEITVDLAVLPGDGDGSGRFILAVLHEGAGTPDRRVDEFARQYSLSPRERDVLRLLIQGLDTVALADHLGISPHTVRDHLKSVYRKTSNRSRSELLSAVTGATNHQPR